MRMVVTGLIAQYPFGGVIWDYLQYLLGFRSLGHEVWYLEDTGAWPYDHVAETFTEDCSRNVRDLSRVMAQFGLADRWIYRNGATGEFFGPPEAQARDLLKHSEAIANVSGSAELAAYDLGSSHLMFLDGDPMFTQLLLLNPIKEKWIRRHHTHFSFGLNIGHPDCRVPTGGIHWQPTVQPVSMAHWPFVTDPPERDYTTVMNWVSYAPRQWEGRIFGQKDLEFQKFLALPKLCPQNFALAMGQGQGHQRPTPALQASGWTILEPSEVVPDHMSYRHFVSRSRAEWSVAKHGYVESHSGWFSGRTACYLMAGRPAVVQETGWSRTIPSGEGLLAFQTLEECCEQIKKLEADYAHHRRQARRLAEEFFAADRVCAKLLTTTRLIN